MVFVLGIWVAVLPYLGFPFFLKNILFSATGLGLIYVSYLFYSSLKGDIREKTFDNFSENHNFVESGTEIDKGINQ